MLVLQKEMAVYGEIDDRIAQRPPQCKTNRSVFMLGLKSAPEQKCTHRDMEQSTPRYQNIRRCSWRYSLLVGTDGDSAQAIVHCTIALQCGLRILSFTVILIINWTIREIDTLNTAHRTPRLRIRHHQRSRL